MALYLFWRFVSQCGGVSGRSFSHVQVGVVFALLFRGEGVSNFLVEGRQREGGVHQAISLTMFRVSPVSFFVIYGYRVSFYFVEGVLVKRAGNGRVLYGLDVYGVGQCIAYFFWVGARQDGSSFTEGSQVFGG